VEPTGAKRLRKWSAGGGEARPAAIPDLFWIESYGEGRKNGQEKPVARGEAEFLTFFGSSRTGNIAKTDRKNHWRAPSRDS
jgi:hypothetical protein